MKNLNATETILTAAIVGGFFVGLYLKNTEITAMCLGAILAGWRQLVGLANTPEPQKETLQ